MTLEQLAECLEELLEELRDSREIIKKQRLEIDILIRKNDTLRDAIAEQQEEVERLKNIDIQMEVSDRIERR